MTRTGLSHADIEAIVAAADRLAGIDSPELLRRRTVEVVRDLVPSTMAAWNEVDLAGRRIDAVVDPPLAGALAERNEQLRRAFIEHVGEHPVIAHYRRTGDGRPRAISDFLSAAAFHATGLYREFYAPLGAEDQISFVLPDPALVIGIALNRSRRGFSAQDRQRCNLLRPHILQAYRQAEAAAQLERMTSDFERDAATQGAGVVRVDGDGRTVELGAPARALLGRFFDHRDGGELPPELRRWLAQTGASGPGEPFVRARAGRRLSVLRLPARSGELLLLSERPDGAVRAPALGLTRREAEVLALVQEGLPSKHIAARLGISPRTVDKHVQHVLDKLGVRNRIGAVALLGRATPPP